MKKPNKVLVLTALPFKKLGNQSLIRFVRMLSNDGLTVEMHCSGSDKSGENIISSPNFILVKILSLHNLIFNLKKLKRHPRKHTNQSNYYSKIKSEDTVPPYGLYNTKTFILKWFLFLVYLVDNIFLTLYFVLFKRGHLKSFSAVIGYECGYTFASRILSCIFHLPYINKFQGTCLKAIGSDLVKAVKFFPLNFFGVNKSDLCIMVNDGTNGKYYAETRGCKNIYFEPHGVADNEYQEVESKSLIDIDLFKGKFVIFNNASGSKWKRTDRIIRSLQYVKRDVLDKLVLVTTYNAPDKTDLAKYVELLGLKSSVVFLENINHITSNYLIRKADVLAMTNEMSNLGNPVLEALFYGTPVISINDGSLDMILENQSSCILIDLDKNFDINLANTLTKLISDTNYYNSFKKKAGKNHKVEPLATQQKKEISEIKKAINISWV